MLQFVRKKYSFCCRYVVQLLTPAKLLAQMAGREVVSFSLCFETKLKWQITVEVYIMILFKLFWLQVNAEDIREVRNLFIDAQASARISSGVEVADMDTTWLIFWGLEPLFAYNPALYFFFLSYVFLLLFCFSIYQVLENTWYSTC